MLLLELFDNVPASKWKWSSKSSEGATAEFTIGIVEYEFHAYKDGIFDNNDNKWKPTWVIEFKAENTGNRYGLIGTGNAEKVMATVVTIMKDFLKLYDDKISRITFAAKEESRKGLYGKMIHRLLPTWGLETKDDKWQGQIYTLTKPT